MSFCKSLRLRISSILRTYVVRSYDQITQHNAKKYRKGKHHTTHNTDPIDADTQMENHTFGEPVPVVHYPITSKNNNSSCSSGDVISSDQQQQEVEPSWTVDVIRKGSNVVVGTIVINNTKLPPRRNKNKKLVWKLPTTISNNNTEEDIPRFGKQDYPRLWEIYKEEKKKRRSLNKTTAGTSISSNNSIDDDTSSNTNIDNNSSSDINRDRHDCINHEIVPEAPDGIHDAGHTAQQQQQQQYPDQTVSSSNNVFIAPPPGFEASTGTTRSIVADRNTHNDPLNNKIENGLVASTIRPPPGFF